MFSMVVIVLYIFFLVSCSGQTGMPVLLESRQLLWVATAGVPFTGKQEVEAGLTGSPLTTWSVVFSGLMLGACAISNTQFHRHSLLTWRKGFSDSSIMTYTRFFTNSCPRSDAIYSAAYDGSGLIEVLRGHEYLSHPFAVTMYGGEVYWTDWRTNTLAKANKWTGHNVTVVQRTNTQPFDLQVYHPSRQPQGQYCSALTHYAERTMNWQKKKTR